MAIMGEAGRKRWPIVEGVVRVPFGEFDLILPSVWGDGANYSDVSGMRTCRSKALISRHLAMMASSSFGKSIDMLGNPYDDLVRDAEVKLSRPGFSKMNRSRRVLFAWRELVWL